MTSFASVRGYRHHYSMAPCASLMLVSPALFEVDLYEVEWEHSAQLSMGVNHVSHDSSPTEDRKNRDCPMVLKLRFRFSGHRVCRSQGPYTVTARLVLETVGQKLNPLSGSDQAGQPSMPENTQRAMQSCWRLFRSHDSVIS